MVDVTLGSKNDGAGFTRDYVAASEQRINTSATVAYTAGHSVKEVGLWVRAAPSVDTSINVSIYDISGGVPNAPLVYTTQITVTTTVTINSYFTQALTGDLSALAGGETLALHLSSSDQPSPGIPGRRVPVSTSFGSSGFTPIDPWVQASTNGTEAPDAYFILGDAGPAAPSITAPASVSPGETISFTASGFTPNAATVSDGTSTLTLTSITNTTGDNYTAVVPDFPAVGDSLQYTTFGAVTLEATDGTDTADDTTNLTAAAGQTVTTLAATFDTSELSYLFDFSGTPATGDQFIEGSADLALDANGGYVADTDGTYVITGIDATDGIAQSYELIVGPAAASAGRLTRRNLTRRTLTRRSLTVRP